MVGKGMSGVKSSESKNSDNVALDGSNPNPKKKVMIEILTQQSNGL